MSERKTTFASLLTASTARPRSALKAEEHRKLQAFRDALGPIDKGRRNPVRAELFRRGAEMTEPDIEIRFSHLLEPRVGRYGASAVGAVLKDH